MDLCYFSKYLLFANICLTSISVNIDLIYLKIDLLNLFLLFRKVYLPLLDLISRKVEDLL